MDDDLQPASATQAYDASLAAPQKIRQVFLRWMNVCCSDLAGARRSLFG
jgi:hypothetical protein